MSKESITKEDIMNMKTSYEMALACWKNRDLIDEEIRERYQKLVKEEDEKFPYPEGFLPTPNRREDK